MTTAQPEPFVDIHCHLVPGIDDGSQNWEDTLAMAQMAVKDGISTIVVTPHQLGSYGHNDGDTIRARTAELQQFLNDRFVPLKVLPGGDVRIEEDLVKMVREGRVMSLADHRKHVLLELPHEMYIPLERLLSEMAANRMVGILSHPERNQGIITNPRVVGPLVDIGCLMQVTAGSLVGTFGPQIQKLSEDLVVQGLVHFISTDAHSPKNRRPLMRRSFERVAELTDFETATRLCCRNPACVAAGLDVTAGRIRPARTATTGPVARGKKPTDAPSKGFFGWRRAG